MRRCSIVILAFLFMVAGTVYGQITYCVDDDAAPNGDGNPENPFQRIQDGIDAAVNGDTVLIMDGIYTGAGNRDLDFSGKAITVRSKNGAENCIIDCGGSDMEPHRGFHFHSGEGLDSIVKGLTIRNGNIADWPGGGGIYCNNSSPKITNNIIEGNRSGLGGGIRCYHASPTIEGNTIRENDALVGGGVQCYGSSARMRNNYIMKNWCQYNGGGIHCQASSMMIVNNIISGNETDDTSGGISCVGLPAPIIVNNTITGNSAGWGGGIGCWSNSSPVIINTILWNDGPQEIFLFESAAGITISYSDVQGGQAGIGGSGTVNWGNGNMDADPLFFNAISGDYRLQPCSPCIDAGTPDGAPAEDMEGNPREDLPDIGAYEYVLGNSPPIADAGPDQTVEQDGWDGASVTLDGSGSSDPDCDPLAYYWSWDSGSATGMSPTAILPLGTTTVTLVVNDGSVDSEPDEVEITVEDTTPPVIVLDEPYPSVLWPPNHKFADVLIIGIAFDICDSDLDIDVSVEVLDAEGGDGGPQHEPDYEVVGSAIGEDGIVWILVSLRAESSGSGDGRIYMITAEVTDNSGNSESDTVEVLVPNDKGRSRKR